MGKSGVFLTGVRRKGMRPQRIVLVVTKLSARAVEKRNGKRNVVCLMKQDAVERYILQNPGVSIQNKINMLNERLMNEK